MKRRETKNKMSSFPLSPSMERVPLSPSMERGLQISAGGSSYIYIGRFHSYSYVGSQGPHPQHPSVSAEMVRSLFFFFSDFHIPNGYIHHLCVCVCVCVFLMNNRSRCVPMAKNGISLSLWATYIYNRYDVALPQKKLQTRYSIATVVVVCTTKRGLVVVVVLHSQQKQIDSHFISCLLKKKDRNGVWFGSWFGFSGCVCVKKKKKTIQKKKKRFQHPPLLCEKPRKSQQGNPSTKLLCIMKLCVYVPSC